jgi:hypothetical protein
MIASSIRPIYASLWFVDAWRSMVCMQAQYLMLLCSFREQLQQHVRVHAVEAVMACREIEQSLQDLTGKIYLFIIGAASPSLLLRYE